LIALLGKDTLGLSASTIECVSDAGRRSSRTGEEYHSANHLPTSGSMTSMDRPGWKTPRDSGVELG